MPEPFGYELPYASQRAPVLAEQVVATSHPLAAQVGLAQLERGGSAVDAAIAAAAALTVLEPTMNGVGGDLFALVWDGARLHGLNASGAAPRAWSLERFAGRAAMPSLGWDAVTVPGAVSGWAALSERFGALPFASLIAPAARYAAEGFPVTPLVAEQWKQAEATYTGFAQFGRVFLPGGCAPRAGSWFRLPELAATLAAIGESRGSSFYSGALAELIVATSEREGGALRYDDLAAHEACWVEPLSVRYGDATLHELPPNGQGMAALIAIGVLDKLELGRFAADDPRSVHLQLEAMKAAFAICRRHVASRERMRVAPEELLAPAQLERIAQRIADDRAAPRGEQPQRDHGTVYVAAADRQGRMVSLIQSNYMGFGSGVVVPGTGIALHNRGLGFSLDPEHPNCVAGGARPYHTIMPGFASRQSHDAVDGTQLEPAMSFGVMGAHMQPQGHVQLFLRVMEHEQNPQAACDAPRWYLDHESRVALEPSYGQATRDALQARGHVLVPRAERALFGGAQAIYKLERGYCAASDPRKDGQAVGS
jgi:gamma-glutamyltranspeptidase/glutathione hydrolase